MIREVDITVESHVSAMVEEVVKEYGHIDILVNCAGVAHRISAEETTLEVWQQTMNVNLQGVFLCGREVGRQMIRQKSGTIINITSINCAVARPNLSAYGASKAGVMQLTRCWALEWAPHNIRVNAVAPSFLKTEMTEKLFSDPDVLKSLLDRLPLKRIGTIVDIAAPVIFLASPAAHYITGQTLFADGGWTIQ
jgi:NAD(P)-dependent dehydrogenase (short-subunit alcohol dehydrogenase family)